jgi:hypothetical protein
MGAAETAEGSGAYSIQDGGLRQAYYSKGYRRGAELRRETGSVIKEALEFLAKIQTPKNPVTYDVHGAPYSIRPDGTIGDFIREPDTSVHYPALELKTLSALIAVVLAPLDNLVLEDVAVHIVDPWTVEIISRAVNEFGYRHVYARALHKPETDFKFANYYLPEDFLIKFRASFYFNEEATKVQKLCSSLEAGSTVSVSDDGMSQTVVATAGTINKAAVTLPAEGIPLVPWRTFREAAPVESKFLLRMKTAKDSLPHIALFDIDEKWKIDTVQAIAEYLRAELPEAAIIFA